MLTHIHPSQAWFTCRTRSIFNDTVYPAQSPEPVKTHQVPRAPLPATGVTLCSVTSLHHIGGHYPSFIAPTDSCARPNPSLCLRLSPIHIGSLLVVVSPSW